MNKPTPDAQLKRKRPPFTMIENVLIEDERISKHALIVCIVLCYHADKNAKCFPGLKRIAGEARCSRSTAQKAIKELIKFGYIAKQTRRENGSKEYTSCIYTIIGIPSSGTPIPSSGIGYTAQNHTGIPPGGTELYSLKPNSLNKKEIASQGAAVELPAKSPHGRIRIIFEELHGKQFSNYGKEGENIKRLIKIAKRLYPDKDPETAITFMAGFLKHLKDTRREKYWREVTISPSALLARWDQVYDIARGNHAQATNWQNMEGVLA